MRQNDTFQMSNGYSEFPSYVERSSPRPSFLLLFVIVLLLIIAALVALYFIGLNNNKELVQSIPTVPTPTSSQASIPTPSPTLTPAPVERSALTVAILNGSGTAGAARGVSSTLDSLGYNIGTIANADNFTYKGLTIHVTSAKSAYLPLLEEDLKKANPNASIAATVDDTIANEAEVIVGK